MVTELLEQMDHMFGDVWEYDTMIHSLCEKRQKKGESMEEYMLQIHEAVVVICCAYPDWVVDQGKNWVRDRFYHGLAPSLQDALEFAMAELLGREQPGASFDTLHTLWLRRWRCARPHMCMGSRGLLMHTRIGTGGILLLWGMWQHSLKKSFSHLILNL